MEVDPDQEVASLGGTSEVEDHSDAESVYSVLDDTDDDIENDDRAVGIEDHLAADELKIGLGEIKVAAVEPRFSQEFIQQVQREAEDYPHWVRMRMMMRAMGLGRPGNMSESEEEEDNN